VVPTAVIFDVDGTLFDSERDGHRVAFNAAFSEADLPHRWDVSTYGDLLRISGGRQRLATYLRGEGYGREDAESLAAALHRRKTEVFRSLCTSGRVPPRSGAQRLLDHLTVAGVAVAVATTGTRAWVEPLLDRYFGLNRFAAVLTGTEVPTLKPSPDVYIEALRQLGLTPDDAVAVEDSVNGLAAARASGLPCLVVVNDYTREHDHSAAGLVVDGFGDVDDPARVMHGPQHALDAGSVTPASFAHVLAAAGA